MTRVKTPKPGRWRAIVPGKTYERSLGFLTLRVHLHPTVQKWSWRVYIGGRASTIVLVSDMLEADLLDDVAAAKKHVEQKAAEELGPAFVALGGPLRALTPARRTHERDEAERP